MFSKRVEEELELEIKKVRIDKESEFKNARTDEYCNDQGIKHDFRSRVYIYTHHNKMV